MLRLLVFLAFSSTIFAQSSNPHIKTTGTIIQDRFLLPDGYLRTNVNDPFAAYLRKLALQEHGSKVKYHNGHFKPSLNVYIAVLDQDISHKNLHQCADAVIRQRAEFLYHHNAYHQIHFHFTNGFSAPYSKWLDGYRIKQEGTQVKWVKKTGMQEPSKQNLSAYLEQVYIYAGTLSLVSELVTIKDHNICPGDVFIEGGSPGHAILVVDVIEHQESGKKKFLLAQSYMPAQQMQILINPKADNNDPWFEWSESDVLVSPEWTFKRHCLMRFSSK